VHNSCPSKILEEEGEFSLPGELDRAIDRKAVAFRFGQIFAFPGLEETFTLVRSAPFGKEIWTPERTIAFGFLKCFERARL
jgi:hypothetical protein